MFKPGKKIKNYTVESYLGSGSFGTVYLVKKLTGKKYAMKCISREKIEETSKSKELFKAECDIMTKIMHPNILHLYEKIYLEEYVCLILQNCEGGTVETFTKKFSKRIIPEDLAIYFLKQLMSGIKILHQYKIMHRDLKLANLFLNNFTVVIGDFGFAKNSFSLTNTTAGTPMNMAPEIIMLIFADPSSQDGTNMYDSKCDLWSIGCCYYRMLFGETLYFSLSLPEQLSLMRKNNGDNLKFDDSRAKVSELSKDILRRLLRFKPKERISWADFFNHPLFNHEISEERLQQYGINQDIYKSINDEFYDLKEEELQDKFASKNGSLMSEKLKKNIKNSIQNNLNKFKTKDEKNIKKIFEYNKNQFQENNYENYLKKQEKVIKNNLKKKSKNNLNSYNKNNPFYSPNLTDTKFDSKLIY